MCGCVKMLIDRKYVVFICIFLLLFLVGAIKALTDENPNFHCSRGTWAGDCHCDALCGDENRKQIGYPVTGSFQNNISYTEDMKHFNCSCESGEKHFDVKRSCV